MGYRAKQVDANQPEVVADLRALSIDVTHLHEVGKGVPDLLLGFNEINFLLEIKVIGGKLNKQQREWHAAWRGQSDVATSAEFAIIQMVTYLEELKDHLDVTIEKLRGKIPLARTISNERKLNGSPNHHRRSPRKRKVNHSAADRQRVELPGQTGYLLQEGAALGGERVPEHDRPPGSLPS